jgi:type II secretory pathway component PulM
MLFRIKKPNAPSHSAEPEAGRPAGSGEQWLGRNRSAKRRLWERLNPRHRKELLMIAKALAMQQTHANLPEPLRARLSESIEQVERLARRMGALLAEVTRRTPPRS